MGGQVSIRQALQFVADNPQPATDVQLDLPVHELISRALFRIANNPDNRVRGSMARATRAQKIILNRLVGTRRPGSHPAASKVGDLEFVDLTQSAVKP
jgi:hypothetical protein